MRMRSGGAGAGSSPRLIQAGAHGVGGFPSSPNPQRFSLAQCGGDLLADLGFDRRSMQVQSKHFVEFQNQRQLVAGG